MMEMEKGKEQHEHSSKYLHLCSTEEEEIMLDWNIMYLVSKLIFGRTVPLRS